MKALGKIKTIICIAAIVAVIFSVFGSTAFAAGSITEARDSVVVVQSENGGYGSGFAIGKTGQPVEYIVTNAHVVLGNADSTYTPTTATVYFSLASNQLMLANVYYYDYEKDVAVLKLPEPTTLRKAMVLCPMKYVDTDSGEFAALGYPDGQVTDWPKYNTDDITVTRGGIKKMDRVGGQDVYMLDLAITNGNSGGPLVNADGEVIGICAFKAGYVQSGIEEQVQSSLIDGYAIAIDELLDDIILSDKIPVTVHSAVPVWMIVVGAAIIVAIIALIIVLVAKKKKDDVDDVEEMSSVRSDNVTGTGYQRPVPPAMPNKAGARVVAIGGTLNGKKFSVFGNVKMGRDSSRCAVSFPVDTHGVSAVHCEIAFDGTVFYVTDLNSRYGTFTSDGRKMTPNVPVMLRSGDKFYLASPENTFEVRY